MLELPAGRLTLDKPLKLTRAQTVLRGAGAKRTTLYLPKSFTDLYGGWWASMGEAGFLAARLAASSVLPAPVRLCGKLRVASPALLKAQTVNICYLRLLLALALHAGRSGAKEGGYIFWGAFIMAEGKLRSSRLARVTSTPGRGAYSLQVRHASWCCCS